MNFINKMVLEFAAGCISDGNGFFRPLIEKAFGLLTMNPDAFSPEGWSIIESLNAVFISIASTLIVIFFLIGFCEDSMDPHNEMRIETVLKSFFKLFLAEFFVINTLNIIKGFFGIVRSLTGGLTFTWNTTSSESVLINQIINNSGANLDIEMRRSPNGTYAPVINNINLGNDINLDMHGLGILLMSIAFFFVMIASGVIILYQAISRMFKILCLIPYGTLANSTIAGNHAMKQTTLQFWKFVICTLLEAVTMMIAIVIMQKIGESTSIALTFGDHEGGKVYGYLITQMVIAITTCGIVKGASVLTQKALGL